MKKKTLRIVVLCSILAMTALGCLMRYYQLQTGVDETGLPIRGDVTAKLLLIFSGLVVLLSALSCRSLSAHSIERGLFGPNAVSLSLGLLSGLVLVVGAVWSILELLGERGTAEQMQFLAAVALEFLQFLAGLSILSIAWLRWKRGGSMLGLHALACLWQVLMLLLNFRRWSMDPTILDYCFRLFALIAGMCGLYHIGAFCLESGRRRMSAFWCLTGVFFSLVSSVGEQRSWQMMELGVFLWLLANAWQLFGEEKQG